MMKHSSVYIVLMAMILNMMQLAAMQEQPVYPWYQSYKNPAVHQRISEGLQSIKKFVKTHKAELAAIAATIAAAIGVGLAARQTSYYKIFKGYSKADINLISTRLKNKEEYSELLKLGFAAYTHRQDTVPAKRKFINDIRDSALFDTYQASLIKALSIIMGLRK